MFLWQRQKVQKMSRRLTPLLLLASLCLPAAILPEGIELHTRMTVTPITPAPAAIWRELGFQEAEKASYKGAKQEFIVSAWRVADSTAAQAAFQLLRPATAKPSKRTKLAAQTGSSLLLAIGNYVLQFDGFEPEEETLVQLQLHMPRFENSSLPVLPGFVPAEDRVPNSERYILGPATLEASDPSIPPSAAGFHFGTEGQSARFRDRDGEVKMVLFSYPNHHIARERLEAFRQIPTLTARRSGPLLAVVTKSPNPDATERVLAMVRYEANITLNQASDQQPAVQTMAEVVVSALKLSGILILFCALAGFGFAGFRQLSRKFSGAKPGEDSGMIRLHIEDESTN